MVAWQTGWPPDGAVCQNIVKEYTNGSSRGEVVTAGAVTALSRERPIGMLNLNKGDVL